MAARLECDYLIDRLRVMIDDQTAVTWDDDALQDILDSHRRYVHNEQLAWRTYRLPGGTTAYIEAFSRWGWYEQTQGGTARFVIRDGGGTVQGTANWTASYINGQVTFGTTQAGSARYLTGYSYDVHATAADCWRDKAAVTAAYYAFQSGNVRVSRDQWFEHCTRMAEYHDRLRAPIVVEMWTDDDI